MGLERGVTDGVGPDRRRAGGPHKPNDGWGVHGPNGGWGLHEPNGGGALPKLEMAGAERLC